MPLTDIERGDFYLGEARKAYEGVVDGQRYRFMETAANLATAMYLRAILDKLNGDLLTAPINSYGEGIGDAIQGQMVRGAAGISQYDNR